MKDKTKIKLADVEHLARLARLALRPEEKETYRGQLEEILRYMEKLDELEIGGLEPLTHPLPLVNVLRKDEPALGLPRAEALSSAPEQKDGMFRVPPVLD